MYDKSKTLYKQLPKITRNKKEYQNKGYSITFDMIKQNFSSRYSKCLYKIDNPKSFDVVLFAIKDNECYKNNIKKYFITKRAFN